MRLLDDGSASKLPESSEEHLASLSARSETTDTVNTAFARRLPDNCFSGGHGEFRSTQEVLASSSTHLVGLLGCLEELLAEKEGGRWQGDSKRREEARCLHVCISVLRARRAADVAEHHFV